MPIRLWSTVEIQLQKPCSALGRANGRAGALVTATAIAGLLRRRRWWGVSCRSLLERLQERHELVDLGLREVEVRHAGALLGPHGLHGRRVAQPALQIVGVELEGGAGERRPALEVGQVRAHTGARALHALHRVAADARLALRLERLLAGEESEAGGGVAGRRLDRLALQGDPLVELR